MASHQASRAAHWVGSNNQSRMPKRWIAFDTESSGKITGDEEIQTWGTGAAIRWRSGLKTGDHAEAAIFDAPIELWEWVTEYCRPEQRTVMWAHNLAHDVRISQALGILPELGWQLEWCNLDRNVSAMVWRSDNGTLVFADTWTWLPMKLDTIAPHVGLVKLQMPQENATRDTWNAYCMRDATIVYRCASDLINFMGANKLGNWQPTGAGMAYATWRHKFMTHKVLVHDNMDAVAAERSAMHTGRAEAWRHGELLGTVWTEVDMRNAYVTIASQYDLPAKLKFDTGVITYAQLIELARYYRVLALVTVTTDAPTVPYHDGERILWPTGTFDTWLWDPEIIEAHSNGAKVSVRKTYVYTRAPILAEWAKWILATMDMETSGVSPVVATWSKHCGRALIGRLSLRTSRWEVFGKNPLHETGISYMTDTRTGRQHRMMHIGDRTLIETARSEGRDSLPQVTGYIMSVCRVNLWRAMLAAGLDEIAHVDTDAIIVSSAGLKSLRTALGDTLTRDWQVKGSWRRVTVYGPRNVRLDRVRKVAGVSAKAQEVEPNVFDGERWSGMAGDLVAGRWNAVTVTAARWQVTANDPRRKSAPGAGTQTVSVHLAAGALVSLAPVSAVASDLTSAAPGVSSDTTSSSDRSGDGS